MAFVTAHVPAYVVMRRKDLERFQAAGAPLHEVMRRRAVMGTSGHGLRRQRWGYLVVASNVTRRHAR